jgi:tRNA threonylcarbamoyladenosine biosynthesis protein TsaB
MSELLLTIDTTTPVGSVAVTAGETLLGEVLLNLKSTHTDRLLLTVRQLLADLDLGISELDGFGVVLGPGSFTGVRVGVATVKGLALATGKPVAGVSTLRTLALQVPFARVPVCALLDARKKEVYAGLYTWEGGLPVSCGEETVLSPDALLDSLEGEVLFVGDGSLAYRTLIVRQLGARAHFVPWPLNLPRASCAAVLALDALRQGRTIPLEELRPCYIRASEAEILWARCQEGDLFEG